MPISPELFKTILSKSRELCTEEAQNIKVSQNVKDNFYNSQPDLDYEMPYEEEEFIASDSINDKAPEINMNIARESKLPLAIKESMMKEQIDVSSASPNGELDRILRDLPQKPKVQHQQQKVCKEGIDYEKIKNIISECIDEKLRNNKEALNEGGLKTINIKKGKIQLIDNKGNVFSAMLKLEGNINNR